MNRPCRDAALEYARRGWLTLPIEARSKRPAGGLGLNHASCDPQLVDTWWRFHPEAGVGLVTSKESGLLAVDVDPRSGGLETMQLLAEHVGRLAGTTLTSRTGGGGWHMLYQHPGGSLRNGANALGPGVDVKALGYIVAPPSPHASGEQYRWLPGVQQPAELPPLLLGRLQRPPVAAPGGATVLRLSREGSAYGLAALTALAQEVATASEGGRNHTLNAKAFRGYQLAAGGELPLASVTDALTEAGRLCGLPEAEIAATLASARRNALRQPATAPPRVTA